MIVRMSRSGTVLHETSSGGIVGSWGVFHFFYPPRACQLGCLLDCWCVPLVETAKQDQSTSRDDYLSSESANSILIWLHGWLTGSASPQCFFSSYKLGITDRRWSRLEDLCGTWTRIRLTLILRVISLARVQVGWLLMF